MASDRDVKSDQSTPACLTTEESVAAALRAAKCRFCYQALEAPDLVKAERDRLRAENERLRAVLDGLDQYVGHDELCDMRSGAPECSCGFEEMYIEVRALVRGMAGSPLPADEQEATDA